jgi:hypothetical protein
MTHLLRIFGNTLGYDLGKILREYFYGVAIFILEFFEEEIIKKRQQFLLYRLFVECLELKVFNL